MIIIRVILMLMIIGIIIMSNSVNVMIVVTYTMYTGSYENNCETINSIKIIIIIIIIIINYYIIMIFSDMRL